MNSPFTGVFEMRAGKAQTVWISGRKSIRPLIHTADDYDDNPLKTQKGHFYFGKQGTFLLWVDRAWIGFVCLMGYGFFKSLLPLAQLSI
jgi:hypothetical protein